LLREQDGENQVETVRQKDSLDVLAVLPLCILERRLSIFLQGVNAGFISMP